MKGNFGIAPTDLNWFSQLRNHSFNQSLVNFWTPTPWNIKRLKKGDFLYFMLKSPIRKIGGYGKFVEYKNMSTIQAWNKYGINNGVLSLNDLNARTNFYTGKHSKKNSINQIGCILLDEIELFDDSQFKTPESFLGVSFARQIVKIKIYEGTTKHSVIAKKSKPKVLPTFQSQKNAQKKTKSVKLAQRKGQPKFRKDILETYDFKCAISGTNEEDALEAAHIEDYINEHSNHIKNGVCLRADIHKLFDRHLIGVDSKYKIFVSSNVGDKEYRKYNGKKLILPKEKRLYPLKKLLADRFLSFRK